MEKLSIVMMTKNEEDKLEKCLERVKWADEIVIVDDHSTDKTVEIAKKFTDKIIYHKCEDNHDRQWNIGIDNATSEWILHIDADELVPDILKETIQDILKDSKGYSAFSMVRRNYFLNHYMKHGGWSHDNHLILFRKDSARCTGNDIHVKLEVKGKIGTLDAYIEHYPFKDISTYVLRQNHYSSAESLKMYEQNKKEKLNKLKYNLKLRPIKLFWKIYIKKGGFKEGMIGFIFSVLGSWNHFLKWLKYYEATELKNQP